MIAESILAIMLQLAPPGQSIYSLTEVAKDAPPACSDRTSLLCAEPKYDAHHSAWVRPETWGEGLARYWTIAQEMAAVSGDDEWMAKALLVVTYHEGAWRADVHSGIGPDAKGDNGRSWCLVQRMLGKYSPKGKTLVGIDADSTRRCIEEGALVLRHARNVCSTKWAGNWDRVECALCVYGGVARSDNRRILRRVATWNRLQALSTKLSPTVREYLGLGPQPE